MKRKIDEIMQQTIALARKSGAACERIAVGRRFMSLMNEHEGDYNGLCIAFLKELRKEAGNGLP